MKKALLINTVLMTGIAFFADGAVAQKTVNNTQNAQNKEILFKIHDVKPNKDEQGFIKDCSYTVTVYNRTDSEVDAASLDLSWADNDGNYVIEQDIVTDEKGEQKFDGRMKVGNKSVNTFIDVPSIPTYSQVSINATAKTEKCYLLLGNVNYRVTSCKMAKRDNLGTASVNSSENCGKMFRYVPVTDPEYYKEFQPVSYEAQQLEKETRKNRDLENIEKTHGEILGNYDNARNILSQIK